MGNYAKKHCIKSSTNICFGYLLESPQRGDSNKYPKHTFYEEIIKQGLSNILFCPLRILYNRKFMITATLLGTNAVVVTRFHCTAFRVVAWLIRPIIQLPHIFLFTKKNNFHDPCPCACVEIDHSVLRWFKKSSCQLLMKQGCIGSTSPGEENLYITEENPNTPSKKMLFLSISHQIHILLLEK